MYYLKTTELIPGYLRVT